MKLVISNTITTFVEDAIIRETFYISTGEVETVW
jgi:hypothetical protein